MLRRKTDSKDKGAVSGREELECEDSCEYEANKNLAFGVMMNLVAEELPALHPLVPTREVLGMHVAVNSSKDLLMFDFYF